MRHSMSALLDVGMHCCACEMCVLSTGTHPTQQHQESTTQRQKQEAQCVTALSKATKDGLLTATAVCKARPPKKERAAQNVFSDMCWVLVPGKAGCNTTCMLLPPYSPSQSPQV